MRGRELAARLIGLAEGMGLQTDRSPPSGAVSACSLVAEVLAAVELPPLRGPLGSAPVDSDGWGRLLAQGRRLATATEAELAASGAIPRDPVARAILTEAPRTETALRDLARRCDPDRPAERSAADWRLVTARALARTAARSALADWRRRQG